MTHYKHNDDDADCTKMLLHSGKAFLRSGTTVTRQYFFLEQPPIKHLNLLGWCRLWMLDVMACIGNMMPWKIDDASWLFHCFLNVSDDEGANHFGDFSE